MKTETKKIKTLIFLWSFITKYKYTLLFATIIAVIGDLLNLIGTNLILKQFINNAVNNILTLKNGILFGLFYTIALNCGMLIYALNKKILFFSIFKLKENIRNYIFQNSLKQSNNFFNDNFVGSLNSKINDISDNTEDFINKTIEIICSIFGFIIVNILFFKTNILLGSLFLFFSVVFMICFYFILKKIQIASEETSKKENESSGKIVDCFSNILSIKIFSTYKKEKYNIKKQSILILTERSKLEYLKIFSYILTIFFRFVSVGSIFFLNLFLVIDKQIEIGTMVTNLTMTNTIFFWLHNALRALSENIESYGKMNQAVDTLFINPEIKDNENAKLLQISDGTLTFNNVNFQYKPELPLVFNNFNLSITSNQKVGLVGYSGSGKSSLINLLLRFYDLTEGELLIDGQNIKTEITQESLRNNISYIPQDPILFHRTIKENITYGKLNATEEEIIEASKKANCFEFINTLENGFDTLVGERGIKLSGGQRQRIAIARAILKNSKILILDEATSALDSITEKEIQIALQNLMQNKTVIAIAHRLSTLDNMDRIIVLDKGQIVEDGTKQLLLQNKQGLFSKMWEMQKGGFIEG